MIKQIGILILAIFAFSLIIKAGERHALLVGISNYPSVSEGGAKWSDIHGENDVALLSSTLKQMGFAIYQLVNQQATANNIRKHIVKIESQVKEGDEVYIHFSCHGQPFEDLNNDEEDGWDESIIPYDAEMMFRKGGYEGKNHIIDDELHQVLSKLCIKLGKTGHLLLVIDACHSGTSSREEDVPEDIAPMRGTNMGFSETKFYRPKRTEMPQQYLIPQEKEACKIIIFEACQPTQRNVEVLIGNDFYGPLSYSVNQMLPTYSFTQEWINSVQDTMKAIIPTWNQQQMVVETNL